MRMRNIWACCCLGMLLLTFAGTLRAEDENSFHAAASVDYFSRYVWRGQNLNNDGVFQFNAEGKAWGFTGAIWSNMPLTDAQGTRSAGEFDEIDYSLDFSRSISKFNDKASYSLGVIHYTLGGYDTPTTEIYGKLSFNVPLSPSVAWYRDVDTIDGSYLEFGLGHTFEKIVKWSDDKYIDIDLSAVFGLGGSGYNAGYFGWEKTKFNDLTLNVAVPFNLKHGISITPSFHVSAMLDGDIRSTYAYGTGDSTNVWFGIKFSKSF